MDKKTAFRGIHKKHEPASGAGPHTARLMVARSAAGPPDCRNGRSWTGPAFRLSCFCTESTGL